jgi:chemotaxis protein MotB
LAAQYPNLLTFDPERGMLRFASDFTFALGSADLSASAQTSLAQLATILNTGTAANFEVRIVGHTDNVPISNPSTRAKHPTNWHLSAHRSISVGSALISDGIAPTRVQVAGCGEYRPIVSNPAKGGAAANRRVEIFLVPMRDTIAPSTITNAPTDNIRTAPIEPMK